MSQKYTVEWCEVKKEGVGEKGPWKLTKMTLKDEEGKTHEDVGTFNTVMPGQELEGFIEETEKNGYKNKNFKNGLKKPGFMKPDISKSVEKAQARTEKSIEKTMDRKEESIKLASAQRDAVLIVTTVMNGLTVRGEEIRLDFVKEQIIEMRNWFLNDETFNNPPPFN